MLPPKTTGTLPLSRGAASSLSLVTVSQQQLTATRLHARSYNDQTAMSVPQKSHPDLLQTVHRLLGSTILITLTDGRTAQGKFLCLDRLGNIILDNAVEKREIAYCSSAGNDSNPGDETIYRWDTERLLTQAVIPGERLFKVQIARKEYEKRLGNLNP